MRIHNRFQKFLFSPAEWLWIQEAKLGDREAFGRLYQLYIDRIYRFVFFKVGQKKEIAEDIVSEVFLKAWEKRDSFIGGSFQAWLYMIARNTVIDFYRAAKNHTELTETVIDDTQNVEETVFLSLETERVKEAMKQLTEEQQELLTLKFINDLSNKEIARVLGKKEDALRAMQHRALKSLQEVIQNA